jgi:hypothetical protein
MATSTGGLWPGCAGAVSVSSGRKGEFSPFLECIMRIASFLSSFPSLSLGKNVEKYQLHHITVS